MEKVKPSGILKRQLSTEKSSFNNEIFLLVKINNSKRGLKEKSFSIIILYTILSFKGEWKIYENKINILPYNIFMQSAATLLNNLIFLIKIHSWFLLLSFNIHQNWFNWICVSDWFARREDSVENLRNAVKLIYAERLSF